MVNVIRPTSERAKTDLRLISGNFKDAYEFVKNHGGIKVSDLGFDWNHSDLTGTKKKGIEFILGDYSDSNNVSGNIRNIGNNEIGVGLYTAIGAISNSYLFNSLGEALEITGKLEIRDNQPFLPESEGEKTGIVRTASNEETPEVPVETLDRYKRFHQTLLSTANKIYQSRVNGQFGDYTVFETPSGFFLAHNKDYANAIYIATDLEEFTKDKQTLRRNGDAIKIDRKGDWEKRIAEYIYPEHLSNTA